MIISEEIKVIGLLAVHGEDLWGICGGGREALAIACVSLNVSGTFFYTHCALWCVLKIVIVDLQVCIVWLWLLLR